MRATVVVMAMAIVGCSANGVTPASRCAWDYQAGATHYAGSVEQPGEIWTCSAPADPSWAPGSLVVVLRNARGGEQFSLVSDPSLFPSGKTVDASGPFKLYAETGADEATFSATWAGAIRFARNGTAWWLDFDLDSTAMQLAGQIRGDEAVR